MKSQKYQKLPKVLSKNDNKIRMLVLSTLILSTGQGSNSLGYKKIPGFSMVTEAFFQDPVVSQQRLSIETNSSY